VSEIKKQLIFEMHVSFLDLLQLKLCGLRNRFILFISKGITMKKKLLALLFVVSLAPALRAAETQPKQPEETEVTEKTETTAAEETVKKDGFCAKMKGCGSDFFFADTKAKVVTWAAVSTLGVNLINLGALLIEAYSNAEKGEVIYELLKAWPTVCVGNAESLTFVKEQWAKNKRFVVQTAAVYGLTAVFVIEMMTLTGFKVVGLLKSRKTDDKKEDDKEEKKEEEPVAEEK